MWSLRLGIIPQRVRSPRLTRSRSLCGWLDQYNLRLFPQPTSGAVRLTLCVIMLFGIVMRVHSLERSFWLDEVWVANAIIAPSLSQMVYYEGWLNTSPPLFLLLVRCATQLFGVSHVSMRVVPVLFGILSIPAMAYLALRLLKPWYALIAVLLLTLSPDHIILVQSVKQYSSDVFVTLVLLILGYHFLRTHSREIFYAAVVTFSVCGFLSYQAIMFLPIFFFASFLNGQKIRKFQKWYTTVSVRWIDIIVIISITCVVSAINYFYFIQPNVRPEVVQGFEQDLYHHSRTSDAVWYFLGALANLTHPLCSLIRSSFLLRVVALAVMVAGFLGFLCRKEGSPIGRGGIVALLALPVLSLVALNVLGQYPIPREPRLTLFIFPVTIVIFASGVQCTIQLCARVAAMAHRPNAGAADIEAVLAPLALVVVVCLFVVQLALEGLAPYFQLGPREDAQAAMRYLSKQHTNGDLLYVHSLMHEHYKFYAQMLPLSGGRIIKGNIGLACCRRAQLSHGALSPAEVMSAEFARLHLSGEEHHVRLLFTRRQSVWSNIDHNERRAFAMRLAEKGCIQVKNTDFIGVRIDEYACQPSASR